LTDGAFFAKDFFCLLVSDITWLSGVEKVGRIFFAGFVHDITADFVGFFLLVGAFMIFLYHFTTLFGAT
jgi:hypothetical protein